jgi:GNAT superfamily N-acetyltransferase
VRRELPGGFELDDDPARLEPEAVREFLNTETRWGGGRTRSQMIEAIESSSRVLGLYLDGAQVGFARATSDGMVAYLADVYVVRAHRGRGLGIELVRELLEGGRGPELRWLLHTADATELYAKLGFTELLRPRLRLRHFAYAPPLYPVMERGPQYDPHG